MKRYWQLFLSNIEIITAAILSVVAAGYGLFGGSQAQTVMLAAIAVTLGLLAYGIVRDRVAREELLSTVKQLQKPRVGEILKVRNAYTPLSDTISQATSICFVGPSLINIFSQWVGYLHHTKLNDHGAKIQALLLDPNSSALDSAAQCMNETSEDIRRDIERSINRIEALLKDNGVKKGSIELRLMSASPNLSMVLIDPDKENGRLFVEFIGYHSRLHTRPHLELTRKHDQEWYEYFLKQYQDLWDDSKSHLSSGDSRS